MIFTILREYAFYGMTAISIIRLRPLAPFSFLHASRKSQVVLLRKESRSCGKTMHVTSWTLEGNTNLIYHINAGVFLQFGNCIFVSNSVARDFWNCKLWRWFTTLFKSAQPEILVQLLSVRHTCAWYFETWIPWMLNQMLINVINIPFQTKSNDKKYHIE